ncbi:hypothetical protein SAMN05192588_1369 [Nonlabens sp. Hel1_33_55]|uniref:hypothetical protein n=1 Tax=Nonlabens sp. Hel1_33_55 TaxID=1336802 RepID=UPI000875DF45|nr:hypothetical protein [Nonlabens sp. Hel1_33_55]SCY14526.1 hypothetical protein SAMN05192588_1369 [Nonlabens sp. Hel1_33_55]
MRNRLFSLTIATLICSFIGFSQTYSQNIKVGDTFKIAKVQGDDYKAIELPKPNFIIKQGGIVNYSSLQNEKVEVTSIEKKDDGSTTATIKKTTRSKFFNSHKYLKVDIGKALENGELVRL